MNKAIALLITCIISFYVNAGSLNSPKSRGNHRHGLKIKDVEKRQQKAMREKKEAEEKKNSYEVLSSKVVTCKKNQKENLKV